jgi:hypothetical protein
LECAFGISGKFALVPILIPGQTNILTSNKLQFLVHHIE